MLCTLSECYLKQSQKRYNLVGTRDAMQLYYGEQILDVTGAPVP